MRTLLFFMLGVYEFRRSATTYPGPFARAYDAGRELAHRATLRRFDQR